MNFAHPGVRAILGVNIVVSVLLAFWSFGTARRDRRNPWAAFLWQALGGSLGGAITAALAANAYWRAVERQKTPIGRALFVYVLSLPGWLALWIWEDATSRRMNGAAWAGAVLAICGAPLVVAGRLTAVLPGDVVPVLVFHVAFLTGLLPVILVVPVYLRMRGAVVEPVFNAARVRERYEQQNRVTRAEDGALVVASNLQKYFPVTAGVLSRTVGYVKAVDDISLSVHPGETLALVGESGCGKTTLGRTLIHLIPPTGGSVIFDGLPLTDLSANELRVTRTQMQIIFQDPYASLNPRMTVEHIIGEAMVVHDICTPRERRAAVGALLERVGLSKAHLDRYPHEFSGGQRQRIGIARAIALRPKFIVCDEAVSALDVSVQAQIINLLQDLQQELGMAYLFLAHDLSVVRHISDRVAVMYVGKIVELATRDELFSHPRHPYTQALLSAIPVPDPSAKHERILLEGDVPTPINPPSGCRFHPRCRYNDGARCVESEPPLDAEAGAGRSVACFYPL